jgi:hypothetical protein
MPRSKSGTTIRRTQIRQRQKRQVAVIKEKAKLEKQEKQKKPSSETPVEA